MLDEETWVVFGDLRLDSSSTMTSPLARLGLVEVMTAVHNLGKFSWKKLRCSLPSIALKDDRHKKARMRAEGGVGPKA